MPVAPLPRTQHLPVTKGTPTRVSCSSSSSRPSFLGRKDLRNTPPASLRRITLRPVRQPITECVADSTLAAEVPPATNPNGIPNFIWEWRGQKVRYQVLGEGNPGAQSVLLVHGLFVNADHWRRNMPALAEAGYRVYSIDLLGYGYSSKPFPTSAAARAISGENGRNLGSPEASLGTAGGGRRTARVQLAHPLGSVYNFYTWSEQLCDFVEDVVKGQGSGNGSRGSTALVCNSIGTISGLQAAVDRPDLFNGVLSVNPNFRELHVAEVPGFVQPIVGAVQSALRKYGQPLFDSLANPGTVKQILKEPYNDASQVTDELVDVLLSPLLLDGAADVVFDTLSYSAGPLPEQLLQDDRLDAPVWVCWGEKDPWTPPKRVLALERLESVKRLVTLPTAGHCPHDEEPHNVNPVLIDFLKTLS